jgi:hypothetical protein
MLIYQFRAERSTAPEHQVPGMVCTLAFIAGAIEAADGDDAYKQIAELLPLPGTWNVTVRRRGVPLRPRAVTKRGVGVVA